MCVCFKFTSHTFSGSYLRMCSDQTREKPRKETARKRLTWDTETRQRRGAQGVPSRMAVALVIHKTEKARNRMSIGFCTKVNTSSSG